MNEYIDDNIYLILMREEDLFSPCGYLTYTTVAKYYNINGVDVWYDLEINAKINTDYIYKAVLLPDEVDIIWEGVKLYEHNN